MLTCRFVGHGPIKYFGNFAKQVFLLVPVKHRSPYRVETRLVDTPELRTSTVMRTLSAVPNISYVYKSTPEIRTTL